MNVDDTIEREVTIAASRGIVWDLVATAGWWIGDDGITANRIEERAGRSVVIHPTLGEFPLIIEASDRPNRISYRWAPWDAQQRAEEGTLVEFVLTGPHEGPTTVRVVESGFRALDLTPEQLAANYAENSSGWDQELDLLKRHLEGADAQN